MERSIGVRRGLHRDECSVSKHENVHPCQIPSTCVKVWGWLCTPVTPVMQVEVETGGLLGLPGH